MSEISGESFLRSMFELEKCLKEHRSKELVPLLRQVLACSDSSKIPFTLNPGLTLYTPSSPNNLHSKKSVVLFAHELSRTGAPVVVADTARVLAENGFFTVVVTMRRGPMLQDLLDAGIPVLFDQELASIINCTKLMDFRNDCFYVDAFSEAFDFVFVVTAVYYNLVRRFSNFHRNTVWWLHEGSHSYEIFGPHMPQCLSSTIKVYTGGIYAKKQLENHGFSYKAKILNYGVVDDYDSSASWEKHGEIVRFLLPGSLSYRKGQRVLLDTIHQLPEPYRNKSEFIFIGDITSKYDTEGVSIKSELISITKTNPSIKYITSVSRDELFRIYRDIDVLTLASLDDPMPVVATEALMLGKVVLCSDATGTAYYLEDGKNGFVFPSGDASALCSKIQYIIDHQLELEDIGKNGRKVFQKDFKMSVFEKNILHIIGEMK